METDDIEKLVDELSVGTLLSTIATICEDKAEHILSNWQDVGLAREWSDVARRIDQLAAKIKV